MPQTYTLTVTLPTDYYPYSDVFLIIENNEYQIELSGNDFDVWMQIIADNFTSEGGVCSYEINDQTVVFTWIDSPFNLVALSFQGDGIIINAPWIPTTPTPEPTTLCPTCQDVTYHWCTDELGIELGIPDGTYTVTITDHGSGVDYSQTVVSAGGVVTIDQTNLGGVFTPFSVYTMTVEDADGPVSWAVGYTEYTCLRFTFTKTINTTPLS